MTRNRNHERGDIELEGARLSNWLEEYSKILRSEPGYEYEADQLEKAANWIASVRPNYRRR